MKIYIDIVSTHSRAEAAAHNPDNLLNAIEGFQHTAARRRLQLNANFAHYLKAVSTHSRAEAAASECFCALGCAMVFQHTAARRRLHGGY